jgi:hypothetical protein
VDAEEARRSMSAGDADTELGNASELESTLDENEEVPASPRAGSPSLPSPPSSPRLHELLAGSPRPGVRFAPATPPRLAPLPQGACCGGLVFAFFCSPLPFPPYRASH